jgi:3-deoxy-D-manno-octulosonate 8-phosphate phosphatase (KDO 8-P phosphatase)
MTRVFKYFAIICLLFHFTISAFEIQKNHALEAAGCIKVIAFDVDGVMTNGEIIYTSDGDEIKVFNVKDGLGLVLASQSGFITAIITGRASPIVERRCQELKICHIYQNVKDKTKIIEELATIYNIDCSEICYMGDDLPDLPALKMVGLACCPSDAIIEIREACSWISSHQGGQGAVRELIDFLIKAKRSCN